MQTEEEEVDEEGESWSWNEERKGIGCKIVLGDNISGNPSRGRDRHSSGRVGEGKTRRGVVLEIGNFPFVAF